MIPLLLGALGLASAQTVRVEPHQNATDTWGARYANGSKVTFIGKVTGIEITKPAGSTDNEVTLLVRNNAGGGTAVVDLGPQWYVDHQVAKVKIKDKVQVTGSKVIVEGRGIVLASMIQVNGQGGLVVALRRQNGRAYWLGTSTAESLTAPNGANVLSGTLTDFGTYTQDNVPFGEATLHTDSGNVTIDLGPQWYYQRQNIAYQVGDNVTVVSGGQPLRFGGTNNMYQRYRIQRGNSVYTLRNDSGSPVYYWGQ